MVCENLLYVGKLKLYAYNSMIYYNNSFYNTTTGWAGGAFRTSYWLCNRWGWIGEQHELIDSIWCSKSILITPSASQIH